MAIDAWNELVQASLAITAALLLIGLLRVPLRLKFGARVAYACWLLAPMAVLAVLLPAPADNAGPGPGAAGIGLPELLSSSAAGAPVIDPRSLALTLWLLGALAALALLAYRQWRFNRLVIRSADLPFDQVAGHGPAVAGLLKPRIVLPGDFRQRYTGEEQTLVLAHEQLHLQRGDIRAQTLASALRCLFWFNPLIHLAAARFRFDQELACDADVLARFPDSRRAYGTAMLKTQLADFSLPLGCHWQSSHPLKERIAMLKHPLPGARRRKSALLLLTALIGAGTYAAWAAQPGDVASPAAKPTLATRTAAAADPVRYLTMANDEDELSPPAFPKELFATGRTGTVLLRLLVGADGQVKEVKVERSAGVFDQLAVEAARKWRLGKRTRASLGTQADVWVRVPVQFAQGDPDKPAS